MEHLGQFIINHWGLWLLLLIIVISILVNESIVQKMRAKSLSPQALVAVLNENEDVLVVDLRDKDSYKKGHIINALLAKEEDFLSQRMDKHKAKKIVLVCARGSQSPALAAKLRSQGFPDLMILAGGMQAWQSSEMPVVKEK